MAAIVLLLLVWSAKVAVVHGLVPHELEPRDCAANNCIRGMLKNVGELLYPPYKAISPTLVLELTMGNRLPKQHLGPLRFLLVLAQLTARIT